MRPHHVRSLLYCDWYKYVKLHQPQWTAVRYRQPLIEKGCIEKGYILYTRKQIPVLIPYYIEANSGCLYNMSVIAILARLSLLQLHKSGGNPKNRHAITGLSSLIFPMQGWNRTLPTGVLIFLDSDDWYWTKTRLISSKLLFPWDTWNLC